MANEYRVSQLVVETLRDGPAAARVSLVFAEVLRSTANGARRRQLILP